MDKELELEDNKMKFLADRMGISKEENMEEMENIKLTEIYKETKKVNKIE